jgi:seryl-tRNA synthetase
MLSKKVYQRALWPLANKFNRKFSSKYPLNINLFRSEEQLESVRQSLKRRFRDVSLADHIAISDKKVRSLRFGLEQHRQELNRLVKDLGKAVQSGSGEVQSMKNLLSTKKEQ